MSEIDDWQSKADADFRSMHWAMQAPTVNYDDVIFHAQQCIEKLLKAILAARGVAFQRTHELNTLAHLLQQAEPRWTWDPNDLAVLQPGAVLLRYPGYFATEQDARNAIAVCERLRESLRQLLPDA